MCSIKLDPSFHCCALGCKNTVGLVYLFYQIQIHLLSKFVSCSSLECIVGI